jgi:LPXTG-motif cell wall-anchored protein
VTDPSGKEVGTGTVGDDGKFDIKIPDGLVNSGDKLGVTQTEPGKDPSDTTPVTVPEDVKDNTPITETSKTPEDVKISRTDGGVYVEGTGEPGATVEVKTPDGDVIGTGKVDDNGHFKVQVPEGAVKPGDKLGVTETEPGKKPSAEVQVDVPNATTTTTQTAVPNSNQGDDSGVATPTTLSVTDDSGNVTPTRVKTSRGTGATLPATGGTGYATGSQDNQKSTPVSVVTAGVQPAQQAAGASGAATASLPKTGDTNEVAIAAFGGALVLGLIGLAGSQRKREN